MNFKHIGALAVGIGLLGACTSSGDGYDTGDTGGPPGTATPLPPAFITEVYSDCTSNRMEFEFTSDYLAYDPIISIFETRFTKDWDEEHPLSGSDHIENEPNGLWDRWGLSLTTGATPNSLNPGSNTVFSCPNHYDEGALTFVIEVFDDPRISNDRVDCVVWGHDPGMVINGTFPGRALGNLFSDCVDANDWIGN